MTSSGGAAQLAKRFAARLEESADHRLFAELTAGTLPAPVWREYLALETDFVQYVAHTYEFCLAESEPSSQSAGFFRSAIVDLRSVQMPLLERLAGGSLPPRCAAPLRQHVGRAQHAGGVAAILASMCAAETLYELWCTRAAASRGTRTEAQQEWIALHAAPDFREGRIRLYGALDEWEISTPLEEWFVDMLDAENDFHRLAYEVRP